MDLQKKIYVNEIRNVHKDLRRKYRKGEDFDKIWNEHCQDDETLDKYAKSMQDLATEIWDEDCDGTHRIQWCVSMCESYFVDGELQTLLQKDKRRAVHYKKDPTEFHCGPNPFKDHMDAKVGYSRSEVSCDKLRLLDVGSCYDPFRKYQEFETTAIDLKPACKTVHKCDFLKTELKQDDESHNIFSSTSESREITILPISFFNIVVFSLLLTYIPSPHARWMMCEKAHKILKVDGLLLVITPDSSHQNKNALLMKKWKSSIEQIGFQRIRYSKDRHLHFMAFRKVPNNYLWDRRSINSDSVCIPMEFLNIPQDFQESSDEGSDVDSRDDDANSNDFITQSFDELPQISD